jgi:hypothetical protein
VGPSVERVTAVQLSGAVLLVDPLNQHWAREVTRSSQLILARLQTLLGKDTVTRIDIRLPRS